MRRLPLVVTALLALVLTNISCAPSAPPAPPVPVTETPTPEETPMPTAIERIQATVVRVIDGDTIEVDIEGRLCKVRYIGIDTPETVHPTRGEEPYGKEACAKNKELVEDRIVELEKDVSETDKYGRLLRYVYVNGLFVNAELVRLGYAQVATYPPDVKYQDLFLQLQREAWEAGRGLWASEPKPAPTPAEVYTLSIAVNGEGTTNPSPGTHGYNEGTQVTVATLPASGWRFDHWGGDASGTSPTVAITMDSNKSLIAYFEQVTAIGSNVQITRIFYDGLVPRVESDEYVEITNLGDEPQDLAGWVLRDISEGYPSFTFPRYILEPGATIRVYTNEIHPEWGGFSFGYGKAIWNNKEPDTAALYNAQGHEVSRKSY